MRKRQLAGKDQAKWFGTRDSIELELDSIELPIELVVRAQLVKCEWLWESFGANWNIAYHWRLVEEGKTLSAPSFVWRWFHVIRTSGSEDTTIWLDSTHQLDRPVSNSIELLFQESKSNPKNVASL
ncbi:unnamed protein product [Microthlaspi erraticum]|uniref:Uncharacterized protein n=1 Tax=Microthlaspi erraticum TaxID=1685480 RepID=A0A6D2JK80_9BRAS|nr:unnamed protein product [Microthlaspi erraticum]